MRGGVKAMAFQRQPDPIVWLVRNDGVLLSCIYDASQKVVAWARHVTQGIVEDVVVGYGKTAGDEVWLVVTRTLGDGSKGRYIERIYPGVWETKDEGIFVDSALSNTMYEYANVAQTPPGGGGGGTGETDEQDDGGETGGGTDPYYPSELPDPDNPWVPEDPSERNAPCPATQCRYKALNATLVGFSENPGYESTPPKKYRRNTVSGSTHITFGDTTVWWYGAAQYSATTGLVTDYATMCWSIAEAGIFDQCVSDKLELCNLGPGGMCDQYYTFYDSATHRYQYGTEFDSTVDPYGCAAPASLDRGIRSWGCGEDYPPHSITSSGTIHGNYSDEDTESDAEARALAAASAQDWTGPTSDSCQVASFRTDRGNTFEWSATQVQHRAQVPDYNPDNPDAEYEVDLWYVVTEGLMSARWVTEGFHTVTKKPTGPGDNWTEWVDIPIPEAGLFAWHMGCRVRVHNSGS